MRAGMAGRGLASFNLAGRRGRLFRMWEMPWNRPGFALAAVQTLQFWPFLAHGALLVQP